VPDQIFDDKTRYLQIAFNYDVGLVTRILPSIVKSERILIEAGTPFIKREGLNGIRTIRSLWRGHLVAAYLTAYEGVPAGQAVGTALAVVAVMSLVGALIHLPQGNINIELLMLLAGGPSSVPTVAPS